MLYHTAFFSIRPGVDGKQLEEMVRTTRSLLVKIPETISIRSGKAIDENSEWPFFYSIECESLQKFTLLTQDAYYIKFYETVIKPYTVGKFEQNYELDPSRDTRYS